MAQDDAAPLVVIPDLSAVDEHASVWRPRPLVPTRVYRFLVRYDGTTEHDVVLPEHHVAGRGLRGDVRVEHRCGADCRQSVRLPVVGCEEALRLYADWWRLLCHVNGWVDRIPFTRVVEQSAFTAQQQIRALGWGALPIFTAAQAVAVDMLIKAELVAGRPRWCYV